MTTFTVTAGSDHLSKLSKAGPIAALSELIWNALDADAKEVKVVLLEGHLNQVEQLIVTDNGTGLPAHLAEQRFAQLGGSWKRHKGISDSGRFLHGSEGKGTPVTHQLRKDGEKLGNYLHAMKTYRLLDDPWWQSFKDLLATTARGLELANRGTMLEPALMKTSTKHVQMSIEVLPSADPRTSIQQIKGVASRVQVDYLNALPEPLEIEANIWYGTR